MRWAEIVFAVCTAVSAWAYEEAPMLAERVARGELPPVAERLPENPLVVQPVHEIGQYGGLWRRLVVGNHDFMLSARLGYEPLVRWDRDGITVVPGLAERWEIRDEGRTYVLFLRRGVRWSDGAPFTSEDLMFWYEDVLQNKELSPVFPSWLTLDGVPVEMTAPDPYTVAFYFSKPYGIFLEYVAFQGLYMTYPKHYLKQFHPRYTDAEELVRRAKERGLDLWYQLFGQKSSPDENPDLPTLKPFVLRGNPTATRVIAERNPYYWKVDPEGHQLPYLDGIAYTVLQNAEILNFKTMTGEADFQDRRIDGANFPLFMENRAKGGYHVMRDGNPTPVVIYINPHSSDEVLRPILADRRFRIALSVAINRPELIDLIYSGMAKPTRGVASPYDPFYLPEFDEKHLEYDPDQANRLLDELGLTRGNDGLRKLPNGQPFRQALNVFPSETGTGLELWELVADYWRDVGLDFAVKTDGVAFSGLQVRSGKSDFWAYATSGMLWIVDPQWYVPWLSTSYFAPLYGLYRVTNGKGGIKPPEEYQRLLDWYLELRSVVNDDARRKELGQRILRQWAEQCYTIGICSPDIVTIVSNRFRNVPDRIIHDYRVMTPGYIGIEQFYLAKD